MPLPHWDAMQLRVNLTEAAVPEEWEKRMAGYALPRLSTYQVGHLCLTARIFINVWSNITGFLYFQLCRYYIAEVDATVKYG